MSRRSGKDGLGSHCGRWSPVKSKTLAMSSSHVCKAVEWRYTQKLEGISRKDQETQDHEGLSMGKKSPALKFVPTYTIWGQGWPFQQKGPIKEVYSSQHPSSVSYQTIPAMIGLPAITIPSQKTSKAQPRIGKKTKRGKKKKISLRSWKSNW